jgi:hypothetical protein
LKTPQPKQWNANQKQLVKIALTEPDNTNNQSPQPNSGPYGAPEQAASPGENPYK